MRQYLDWRAGLLLIGSERLPLDVETWRSLVLVMNCVVLFGTCHELCCIVWYLS
jgi:hypothetical protein